MAPELIFFLALAFGIIFGGSVVWFMLRTDTNNAYAKAKTELAAELSSMKERLSAKDTRIEDLNKDREQLKAEVEKRQIEVASLQAANAELELRVRDNSKRATELSGLMEQAQERLAHSFRALSQEALQQNNRAFLDLAEVTLGKYQDGARTELDGRRQALEEIIRPLRDSLGQVDKNLREIEKARAAEYAGVSEQVRNLVEMQGALRAETANLVNALRTPAVRGRWGEVQLRRVVEMAGMVSHCDFQEQSSVETGDGRLRPDMVVHLPNSRRVVVDAKVSLKAYLEALEATDDDARTQKLKEHAAQVRSHLQRLGSKSYWDQFDGAPEFVVAFLPGEVFFSAALQQDPGLIEFGVDQQVILATPTTLIALLKAVAYGWRQEKLAENAQELSALGRGLYDRLCTFTDHMSSIRKNLLRTVESYNRAAGSLESRVLVSARRFQELGAGASNELPAVEPVDSFPRSLEAVERAVSGGAETALLATLDEPVDGEEDRLFGQDFDAMMPPEGPNAESPEPLAEPEAGDSASLPEGVPRATDEAPVAAALPDEAPSAAEPEAAEAEAALDLAEAAFAETADEDPATERISEAADQIPAEAKAEVAEAIGAEPDDGTRAEENPAEDEFAGVIAADDGESPAAPESLVADAELPEEAAGTETDVAANQPSPLSDLSFDEDEPDELSAGAQPAAGDHAAVAEAEADLDPCAEQTGDEPDTRGEDAFDCAVPESDDRDGPEAGAEPEISEDDEEKPVEVASQAAASEPVLRAESAVDAGSAPRDNGSPRQRSNVDYLSFVKVG